MVFSFFLLNYALDLEVEMSVLLYLPVHIFELVQYIALIIKYGFIIY